MALHALARDGHFAVRDWERVVHPARESVPILLAAVGPQTLDLAGAIADGVILNALASTDFLAEAIPRARAAGSPPPGSRSRPGR
ncbi:methylenetetrahydromethanopterin reductase [compost metagenome]